MDVCAEQTVYIVCLIAAVCCAAAAGSQAFNPYAKMQGQQDNPYAVSMALVRQLALSLLLQCRRRLQLPACIAPIGFACCSCSSASNECNVCMH